jgi:hypothetical protein
LTESWRAIFWINLPMGIIASAVLLSSHLATRPRERQSRPGLVPAAIATLGLVGFCLALSSGGEGGLSAEQGTARLGGSTNPLADYRWPILLGSLVAFTAFVVMERRARTPLLPRDLISKPLFQVAGLANLLIGAALIIAMVNAPLAVAILAPEDRVSLNTALLLGSFTLAMTVGALTGGRLVNRVQPRRAAALGLFIAGGGFVSMNSWPDTLDLQVKAGTMALAGLGLGIVIAPIGEVAIRAARSVDYGAASGLVLLARLLGMTLGLAGITAYGLERLDRRVDALPPISPLPGETTSQYFLRQQEFLTAQLIPLTLDVIRETFIIAAIVCGIAVLVVSRMRTERL